MALYYSKGTISDMSELQSIETRNGIYQKMTITLDVPGYQGSFSKQIFQVMGDSVNKVMQYNIGDRVQIGFALYAREYKGRLYNNVMLVKISDDSVVKPSMTTSDAAPQPRQYTKQDLNPAEHEDLPF